MIDETVDDRFVDLREVHRSFSVSRHSLDRSPSTLTAVDRVSLEIRRGECLGLVGESGCGKSTLARIVSGLTPPTSGAVRVEDVSLADASKEQMREFRRRVQIVFQDPYSSLDPRFTVRKIVAEGLAHLSKEQRGRRVAEVLDHVGLPGNFIDRYPHQLSGGQRQRVSIARALAVEPQLLVLDEPVSALDVSMQAQVLNLLQDLQKDLGLTYLFISHDLAVVRHVAHRVAVMYLGQIVELAETRRLFDSPQHPYTHALLSAAPSVDETNRPPRVILAGDPPSPLDLPSHCRFSGRCFRVQDRCRTELPVLEDAQRGHSAACFFPGPLRPEEVVADTRIPPNGDVVA
jgi:oligopeptide/dipeptide ABC transporter ATP-binding protein